MPVCVAVGWKAHQRHLRQTEKQAQVDEVNRISSNEAVLQQRIIRKIMTLK